MSGYVVSGCWYGVDVCELCVSLVWMFSVYLFIHLLIYMYSLFTIYIFIDILLSNLLCRVVRQVSSLMGSTKKGAQIRCPRSLGVDRMGKMITGSASLENSPLCPCSLLLVHFFSF